MSADVVATAAFGAAIGAATAQFLVRFRLLFPPRSLMRVNFRGVEVPAILGGPLVLSGLLSAMCVGILGALGWDPAEDEQMAAAVTIVLVVMGAAGAWDDRKGDERPRGFRGHVGALRGGTITGGLVKLGAGAAAGLGAGAFLATGWRHVLEVAFLVALTANLVNLFDRAPGRAGKVALMLALPLGVAGSAAWLVIASGTIGALVVCLVFDLGERAMLGDAGANPLGAVLGIGLAASLPEGWRLATIAVLLALNIASERWSFSGIIARLAWLRALDELGRRP